MAAVDLSFRAAPISGPPYNLVFGAVDVAVTPTAAINLVFRAAPISGPPYNLVFGAVDAAVAPEDLSLSLRATLPGLTLRAGLTALDGLALRAALPGPALHAILTALDGITLQAAALPSLTLRGDLRYDNRVTRWLGQSVAAFQQSAVPQQVERISAWGTSLPRRGAMALPWRTAQHVGTVVAVPVLPASPQRQVVASRWQPAVPQHRQSAAAHQAAVQHHAQRGAGWQGADRRSVQCAAPLQTGLWRDVRRSALWQTALAQVRNATFRSGASLRLSGVQLTALWQMAGQARNGRSVLPVQPPVPTHPRDGHLVFEFARLTGSPTRLVFGLEAYLAPRARIVVPFLRTYVTVNSITLRRVSDSAPVSAYGFSMSLDYQSWTWSWSASIPAAQLALVRPGVSGDPIELEVLVNGAPYRLCAEGLDRQREFAKGRVGVKGRGTAAILDAPYAPVLNFGNAQARTAQQLMLDALTINGVGIGWDVDFGLTDWLVPGNAWTHQGTYISAVLDIAGAAGGYVQPNDTAQTLRILPRYPVAPWAWDGVTPDFELPGIATVEGIEWQRKAAYNRIYVSGISAGVLGQVTRAGTAGDSVAPMVTHALITHADAARQRGLAELADTGRQARVTLKLPVLQETGLILPGKFVRYLRGGEAHLGLTRSIALDWSMPKLRQTISVETHL